MPGIDIVETSGPTFNSKIRNFFSKSNRDWLAAKIWMVAKIALMTLLSVGLFLLNPSLFAIGFIAGIIWNEQAKKAIDKIVLVAKSMHWGYWILGGVASFLSLPVTIAASSVLWSTYLGSQASFKAQKKD
jgi:hypothetical protein